MPVILSNKIEGAEAVLFPEDFRKCITHNLLHSTVGRGHGLHEGNRSSGRSAKDDLKVVKCII
jgi:hypothetical protein